MGVKARPVEEVKYNEHLGDLNDFYAKNSKLIHSVCQRYRKAITSRNMEYDDLFQIGVIGFMKAYEKFDPTEYDVKFSTYAVPTIIGEIRRHFRDAFNKSGMHVPRSVSELASKIFRDETREEDPECLAQRYETTVKKVKDAIEYINISSVRSMDATIYDDEKSNQAITLEDQMGVEADFTGVFAEEFLSELTETQRAVTLLRMESKTQVEIGEAIGLSQVQVSRIIQTIGKLLKKYLAGERVSKKPIEPKIERSEEKLEKKTKEPKDMSVKELVLAGYDTAAICEIKGCAKSAVYNARSVLRIAQKLKAGEATSKPKKSPKLEAKKEPVEYRTPTFEEEPKVDVAGVVMDNLKKNPFIAPTNVEEELQGVVINPEPKLESANTFVASSSGALAVTGVVSFKNPEKPKKTKNLEFNLSASNSKASKEELMEDFAKIIETVGVIGVDAMSYEVSIQLPSVEK